MMEMAMFEGKCPNCGKIHISNRKGDIVVCDCWQKCPTCGAEMTPYTPDTAPKTYALNGLRELQILMVCTRHSPPFFSQQKPVEVQTDAETP
jgi:ribosomal protein L32